MPKETQGESTATVDRDGILPMVRDVLEAGVLALTGHQNEQGDWWVAFELRDGALTRASYGRL